MDDSPPAEDGSVDGDGMEAGMESPPGPSRGVGLFNQGRYWEAHEAWEEAWIPDRHGPDRGFYKGLIQVAAGCLHYTRRNRRGTQNKWRSGADLLRPYLPVHRGVELSQLVERVDAMLAEVEASESWSELRLPQL